MMYLSLILLILTLAADAILGLVVWLQAPRKKLNIVFALLAFSFIIWSATSFYDQTASGSDSLLSVLAGTPFIAGVFMAYFITLFSLYFPEFRQNAPRSQQIVRWILRITTLPLLSILLFGLKFIIASITTSAAQGNNITPGPLYGLFLLYFVGWIGFALVNLFRKFRQSKDKVVRLQLNYIFFGFFAMTAVTILTNVVLPVVAHNPAPARFGFLSTLFIIGFIGYAIAAHRLFNIRLLVARSLAYILLLGTLTSIYGLAVFGASNAFFRNNISFIQIVVFIVLAFFLVFTFQPLRRLFEKVTDRIFFHDQYDSQVVLDDVSEILASELLLEPLLKKSLKVICWSLRIGNGQFIILDGEDIYTRTALGSEAMPELNTDDLTHLRVNTLVADELAPGSRRAFLEQRGISVALELRTREELVGYLLLGYKLSGELYSDQDLTVLEILRKELAVAIVNAKSYEEIAHFNATLQERIRNATHRLRTANRNLQVLDKTKDDFISMASHQLGTPLTAITGYLSMALDDDQANMTVKQREYVNYALEAAERMVSMSSDLLNVSRLSSGRFMIQRQPVDLSELAQQEVQQLRPSAERKKLQLVFKQPDKPLPMLSIDESKTRQVIMNFVDNAIYYTPQGNVTVEVREFEGAAEVLVTDSGIGVPEDEKRHLFSKFYRAENAKAERPDGTGLGLYLAKRVIEDQGGSIIFKSEEGKGSTFGFALPLKTTAVIVLPQRKGAETEAGGAKTEAKAATAKS